MFTLNRIVLKTRHAEKQLFCPLNKIRNAYHSGRITESQQYSLNKNCKGVFPLLGQKQSEIFKFERFDKDKLSGNFLPKYKDVVIYILAFTTVLIILVPLS